MSRLWIIYPVHNGRDYRKFITRRRGDGRWTTVRKEGREVIRFWKKGELWENKERGNIARPIVRLIAPGKTTPRRLAGALITRWFREYFRLPYCSLLAEMNARLLLFANTIHRVFYSVRRGDHPLIIRDSIKVGFLPNVYLLSISFPPKDSKFIFSFLFSSLSEFNRPLLPSKTKPRNGELVTGWERRRKDFCRASASTVWQSVAPLHPSWLNTR